eukprot:gnl/TRDRNA2_/TRDRNA2_87515_c1_seq1.p1 gnl/TRDRNA2_/TRDRNA2_87515_c1~~gnl/TRDRNA2_/TRDRNA2_87515_c1_seq1.p1  ORF type:complete len:666 (-),score=137.87 gnl/TRDRNA2_/TRDRNA2_87515_c1_seq1:93-2090(-)
MNEHQVVKAMKTALIAAGLYCDQVSPPATLADLLSNVFDAADEDNIGDLPHYEVARLLGATLPGFDLEEWDIHLLLTSAQETHDGCVECKPFIQAAPEIIQALRKRRINYRNRGLPGVELAPEAIKHCFQDELSETANCLMRIFEQCAEEEPDCARWAERTEEHGHKPRAGSKEKHDHDGNGEGHEDMVLAGLKRRCCRDCVSQLPERLSPQEAQRLLQMLPEDEEGLVYLENLLEVLEKLREGALLNALIESDVCSLRTHLIILLRRLNITPMGKLHLWALKHALLQADQVCLSRLQIHVLLCLAKPDAHGYVDAAEFLKMCCTIIPHLFNAEKFVGTAERLQAEHAEMLKAKESAELAALGGGRAMTRQNAEGDEGADSKHAVAEVDRETVEKTLIQVFSLLDDTHRNPVVLPPETMFNVLMSTDMQVQSCALSETEICGLAAEMTLDADGQCAYVEHVKRWVPVIFELRRNQLLCEYLRPDAYDELDIQEPPELAMQEQIPLMPTDLTAHLMDNDRASRRASGHRSSRRNSKSLTADDVEGLDGERKASVVRRPSKVLQRRPSKEFYDGPEERLSKDRRRSSKDLRDDDDGGGRLKGVLAGAGGSRKSVAGGYVRENPAGRGFERRRKFLEQVAVESPPPALGSRRNSKDAGSQRRDSGAAA